MYPAIGFTDPLSS